jgi:hypothetical protein
MIFKGFNQQNVDKHQKVCSAGGRILILNINNADFHCKHPLLHYSITPFLLVTHYPILSLPHCHIAELLIY